MIMNKAHFIRTSDEDTANKLAKIYNQVGNYDGHFWTFVNDVTMKFSNDIDQSKVTYTNKLCI